jgi:hypothetical protein
VLRAGLWIFAGLVALWLVTEGSWLDLFALASGGTGVYLLWTSARGLLAGGHTPDVGLSPSELAVGQPFVVRWGPDALESRGEVTAWLICRETARRSNAPGAGAADVHEWIVREVNDDVPAGRPGGFSLAIPDDAMHSFRAGRNAIEWLVEIELHPRRGSVARASLPLTVLPRLHGEATDAA